MVTVVHTAGPARARLEAALTDLAKLEAQTGWFSSSKYPNGTPAAYVASIHEYGYAPKNIPPRMGLRAMVKAKVADWSKVAAYGAKQILTGAATVYDVFTLLGATAEADIRKQIASVTSPPLQPATIEARRRRSASGEARTATGAKPLNDTGYLIATPTHIVAAKGSSI